MSQSENRHDTISLLIEGMTCASCVARVEKGIKAVPGVTDATVNLATERATVRGTASAEAVIAAIEKTGYEARPVETAGQGEDDSEEKKEAERVRLKRDLILASVLALPVFVLEMGSHLIPGMHEWVIKTIGLQQSWYWQFALTLLVLTLPGRRFYLKGFPALARLAPDMNSLVAVGTAAAFGYSLVATFTPDLLPEGTVNVYYEAAAVIVALILLGRFLEARAKGRTSEAIKRLVGLQARVAHVLREGRIVDIPVDEVVLGDCVEVRPGERIPVDGEVTEGRPVLTDLDVASGFERREVLAKVAAVESRSEHPIARAIVVSAEEEGIALPGMSGFESVTGMGVYATVDGTRVDVGADRYMREIGVDISGFATTAERLGQEGKSPLYAAIDGQLAAIIAVADPIKPSTPAAINALHQLGIKVAMITGDNARTAQAIARQLGIDDVVAEVLPEGKVEAIRRLKAAYGQVAFVGDGINDAPALAESDVGLAIGTGTDVAVESADVVLMSGNLQGVPNAIALSKATIRNIHQNLFWAFAYNTALIPVAAGALFPVWGILLSPVFAAGAMAMSSVFVLGNALRLRRFRAPMATPSDTSTT
ncbi:heavy metal translocating P-type ATPase [Salmonella enterica]|nr:heavy metal translocating P-type ATPase [Salmonella enterica]